MKTFILLFTALFVAIAQFITPSTLTPEKIELLTPFLENVVSSDEMEEESDGNIVIHGLILPEIPTDPLFYPLDISSLDNISG